MRQSLFALFGLVVFAAGPGTGHASDLATMRPSEIVALQKRLADAGCYRGELDGAANAETAAAVKACPDQDPVLRIETGMHLAPIKRVGVDAACRLMVTGSDDKTVRLWSLPDGRLRQVIRLPIGPGNGGKVYAVALSQDGRTLAVGGWDAGWEKGRGMGLYLIDLPSGTIRRIGAYTAAIDHIAISADGTLLAVALGLKQGVRVIEVATGREIMADRDYATDSYGVTFAPNGSIYAASYDGFLRRYGPDLKLGVKVKAPDGGQAYGVAVSPDGRRVAVGYNDTNAVSILDAQTLPPIAKGDTGDLTRGNRSTIAWLADNRQIVAGGRGQLRFGGTWREFVRRFDASGRRLGDTPVSGDTVLDLEPCGSGIAFGVADPSFGLMQADGQARTLQGPATADMRSKIGGAFTISPKGTSIRFGLGNAGARPVLFDLLAGTLTDAPGPVAELAAARTDGLPVTDWHDRTDPKLDGKPIKLKPYEIARTLAIRPDRTGFMLGADWQLQSFDATGTQRWTRSVPGIVWGVGLSTNGEVVVAAYGDGTIRWHRWSDGQELLALFINKDTRAWVAWTPSGYYTASPGAEDMIGWHLNRGWNQAADFFPASRFRDRFNRPDVVGLVLDTMDEGEALRQANAASQRRDDTTPIIERLPPVITITSPTEGSGVAPGTVEIRFRTRSPSGAKIDRVEAFLDGAKVGTRGLARIDPDATVASAGAGQGSIALPMPARDAVVSLIAYADGKASDAARVTLKGTAPASSRDIVDEALKPNLYALLIGVAHYENKSFNLEYPAKDAAGLAEALKGQEGKLYRHVEVKVLTDTEATATAVKRGLTWLKKQTTAHDLAIVFAAGHGTTDAKGKFWFLPYDMDPDDVSATAVSRDDISDVLFDLPGKKLLFLDACHSGAALNAGARGGTDIGTAVNDFAQAEGGVVAYAASTGREFSFERDEWGHGAFTKALIEGFSGQADLLKKGTVTTATLDLFLAERVKELTGGQQHPVMTRPKTVPDFPIAAVP